jgi:branched-chain amino acid transport system ATP-binding protein
MSSALETIHEDHRGMWRLTTALQELCQQLGDPEQPHDIELFGLILDYIERYIEQVHQPKEEGLLYRAVRRRSGASDELIAGFEREHAASPAFLAELRLGLQRLAQRYPEGIGEFQAALGAYVAMMQGHIKREETLLFPAARQALSDDDWTKSTPHSPTARRNSPACAPTSAR